jgi:hypothetical protein
MANLSTPLADTWELIDPCTIIGPGHPGGGLPITCAAPPRPGTSFCVSFERAGPGPRAPVLGGACLNPPLAIGPPGTCTPGFVHALPIVVFGMSGSPASFCLPVPALPALVGTEFCLQGASLEPSNCFRLTDGLAATVVP